MRKDKDRIMAGRIKALFDANTESICEKSNVETVSHFRSTPAGFCPAALSAIDVIILAAGLSSRFGDTNKLLAPFRGRSLVRRALELACSIPLGGGRVIFVYSAPEVRDEAAGLPVHVVHNPRPELGLSGSVRLGVAASSAPYYLFLPADQPLLDAATIAAVTAQAAPGRIIVPVHGGRPGNPALFSSSFREELLALPPGEPPRLIKERHAGAVVAVEIDNPLPLADIDTEGDLRELERAAPAEANAAEIRAND